MANAPPPLRAATEDVEPPEGGQEEGERKEGAAVPGQHAGFASDTALLTRDVGEGVGGGIAGAAAQVVAAQPAAGQPATDEAAQQELRLQRRVLGPKVRYDYLVRR